MNKPLATIPAVLYGGAGINRTGVTHAHRPGWDAITAFILAPMVEGILRPSYRA